MTTSKLSMKNVVDVNIGCQKKTLPNVLGVPDEVEHDERPILLC